MMPDSISILDVGSSSAFDEAPSSSASAVHPLDAALARWMSERDPEHGAALRVASHVLSMARRDGHTALSLTDLDENEHLALLREAGVSVPPTGSLSGALEESRLVGAPKERTPLVLDEDLLFFRRFHDGERRIAEAVRGRLEGSGMPRDPDTMKATFGRLFNKDADSEVDWQAVAAAAALRSRILCIAGGPGTGKTTAVTRLMALLLSIDPDLRIALAAPTGKAANRMAESIAGQLQRLDLAPEFKDRVPTTASTLHRLLGYRPTRAQFTYGADCKLKADVVIVDEASMIDQELFTSLLSALNSDTQIILLGDPDQLPSIEAGFVFGDLCRAGEGTAKSTDFVGFLSDIGLDPLPPTSASAEPMGDAVITLTRGYRFGPDSGIGHLADALRDDRSDDAISLLNSDRYEDIRLVSHDERKRVVRRAVRTFASKLIGAATPAQALAVLDRLRVLSPLRVGPLGVEALNEDLEAWLLDEQIRPWGNQYAGKPILITTNDYDVSLFNGDVGVLWKRDGRFVGCFPDGDGIREIPVPRLPPHEVAWAMTIHKSQGSEFDDVVLVLPGEEDAGQLTRELLYTAVTRARMSVTVVGDADVIAVAAGRREQRVTGLGRLLQKPDSTL